jgi:hypothetical protein
MHFIGNGKYFRWSVLAWRDGQEEMRVAFLKTLVPAETALARDETQYQPPLDLTPLESYGEGSSNRYLKILDISKCCTSRDHQLADPALVSAP